MFINIIKFQFIFCKYLHKQQQQQQQQQQDQKDHKNLVIYKLWHWPRMLQRFLTSSKSSKQNTNLNTNETVYLVEGIVYATTNNTRFARSSPLLENDQWYQSPSIQHRQSSLSAIFSSTSGGCGICSVQAVDNPTAMNNPLLLSPSIWRRVANMFRRKEDKLLYVGQEFESLLLNIWMPRKNFYEENNQNRNTTKKATKLLPVYCYVAGGAFTFGSGNQSMHDPRDFILSSSKKHEHDRDDDGAIFVTLNYRLGILGFLQGIEGVEPNLGLYDIVNALFWIRKNISQFGGDPENVCVIGQSAGAMSLAAINFSPYVKQKFQELFPQEQQSSSTLFKTSMLMSGAALHCHGPAERNTCGEIMKEKIEKILLSSSSSSNHHQHTSSTSRSRSTTNSRFFHRELLEKASLSQIIQIQQVYCQHIDNLYRNCELETRFIPFNLCVDETNNLIPIHPQIYLRRQNSSSSSSTGILNCQKILISTTGSEYTMFAMKHQQAKVMNNDKLQVQQTMKRAKQFVAAAFEIPDRNDPHIVVPLAAELTGTYSSLWKSTTTDYISRMFTITSKDIVENNNKGKGITSDPKNLLLLKKLTYRGQLWSVFCGDWTFRIPAEALMNELEKILKTNTKNKISCKKKNKSVPSSSSFQQLRAAKFIRIESPCDAIPVLSSPHTSDVPFLLGTLHVFPPISGHKWLTCERRQNFSRRLQIFVKDFHENDDENEEEEDEDENYSQSEEGLFWSPKNYSTRGSKFYKVFTLRNDEQDGKNIEYAFERGLCNEKFDQVMHALMKFREVPSSSPAL